MSLVTYDDLVRRLLDFVDGSGEKDTRDARRAAQESLRELSSVHPWTYYVTEGRLNVFGPYSTGTVAYTSSTRTLTLTGGTWPTWANDGVVNFTGLRSEVDRRESGSQLTLAARSAPGEDLTAGTAYVLERDSYPTPLDFYKPITGLLPANRCGVHGPQYIEPSSLGECQLFSRTHPRYTIVGSSNYQGVTSFRFDPAPALDASYQYWYRRNPRRLSVEAESTGTVAVTAGSTTVTGTGTAFSQKHVGTALRIASDANPPTGDAGDNPFDTERIVMSVESATSLTVDGAYDTTASGKGFTLSDPVDVAAYMLDGLFVTAQYKMSVFRNRTQGLRELASEKDMRLRTAAAADNKTAGRRFAGRGDYYQFGTVLEGIGNGGL